MRIRFKKWARPELAASPFCMDNAFSLAGKWRAQFAKPEQPFYVELGCGKGGWVSQAAVLHPADEKLLDSYLGLNKVIASEKRKKNK